MSDRRVHMKAKAPSGARGPIFAIGDVHGCAQALDDLLQQLPLRRGCTLVFLGDIIDRGPHSRQVIDRVLDLSRYYNVVTLLGNHEAMLLEFLEGRDVAKTARYILNGGSATLANYADREGRHVIPRAHFDFLRTLPSSYETDEYFFVHAGVPDVPLATLEGAKDMEEMLWIRKAFLESSFRWEKIIVHGHSAVRTVEVAKNRINLDTGCAYGRALSAMEFPAHRIYTVAHRVEQAPMLLQDSSRRAAVRFRGAIPVGLTVGHETYAFETVDYSEIGLGVRVREGVSPPALEVGARVTGWLGEEGRFRIRFDGSIVRLGSRDGHGIVGLHIELRHADDGAR